MSESTLLALLPAAVALSIERVSYLWIWRNPATFEALCARGAWRIEPVAAVQRLFYVFKSIQAIVFFSWIAGHGHWFTNAEAVFLSPEPIALGLGGLLAVVGQVLNFSVFYRLGSRGTFYGIRFGHELPWVRGFPFSVLDHPQYVGTVATIWGFFLFTRFPEPDWILLPLLETLYYLLGAHCERDFDARAEDEHPPAALESECTAPVGDGPE